MWSYKVIVVQTCARPICYKQRKANSNLIEYNKNNAKQLECKKLLYNQTEILIRESLPLRQNYKKKVQEYFSIPDQDKK